MHLPLVQFVTEDELKDAKKVMQWIFFLGMACGVVIAGTACIAVTAGAGRLALAMSILMPFLAGAYFRHCINDLPENP